MKLKLGKKGIEFPLHWLIIFVIVLFIIIYIAYSAYTKSGGLLGGLADAVRGRG